MWLGFLTFGTVDIRSQVILCCGCLSCASQGTEQHPWSLPPRCQCHPLHPPGLGQPKMSADLAKCLLPGKILTG